jgi:hypothetical protein
MGLFDRLFGDDQQQGAQQPPRPPRNQDDIEIERYRYLLRTAPPGTIEQVHTEAFGKLTPEQRQRVFQELSSNAPAGEAPSSDEPQALAKAATRSELRQPGTLERSFAGPSFGSMLGASLLGTVAGYVVGSALVSAFMPMDGGANEAGGNEAGADSSGDSGSDGGSGSDADAGGADAGGAADAGGGWGDSGGGDAGGFGGGDFGGGDFGGGDFGGDFGF